MRIIAGKLGGRIFDSPGTFRTHPMSDKARGALFNILGDVSGSIVWDAFAGTGALSFEAISRGATKVVATEIDRAAQKVIAKNIANLGLGRNVQLVCSSCGAWLSTNNDSRFDLILCDPPYNDLQPNVISRLASALDDDGIFVVSWPTAQSLPTIDSLECVDFRAYGDITLAFYKKLR
jgi:16S rRNA (guanine966-N2)-methyltransferase